jgi:hypothetical protein
LRLLIRSPLGSLPGARPCAINDQAPIWVQNIY